MSAAVAFAPNRYSRVHLNTASLNNAPPKALVGASLKGYSLHCIIFRTATEKNNIFQQDGVICFFENNTFFKKKDLESV